MALRSGNRLPILAGLREEAWLGSPEKIQTYDDLSRLDLSRMSGCAVVRCVAGCRKVSPAGLSTPLKPAAVREYRSLGSILKIFVSTMKPSARPFLMQFFPKGSDWLSLGPTGPRRLRLAVEHLAQYRGGICFMVDLDPRWVIKLLKMGQPKMAEQYKQHVIEQGLTLLRAHDNIRCLFTTPKLLEALCEKVSLKKLGITGVFCGGTEMTPQFHRFAVEELLEGAYFAATYGNTLMGLAVHKPRIPEDNYAIIYYPPLPRAMIEVVDPDNPDTSR